MADLSAAPAGGNDGYNRQRGADSMSYKLVEKQVLYRGKKVTLELHHLDDEETGARHLREVVIHPGAVVVLGFLPDDQILLIRTKRYAVQQVLLELPAGTLEKNEDPINCAGRELLEETGYLATKLVPIGNFFTSPGILSEKMYAYAAYDLHQRKQALEEGEDIEVVPTKFDDAIGMIHGGEIHDGKTIAALLMYERFHRKKN
jgi:ADP-ribose pyrophosphatase